MKSKNYQRAKKRVKALKGFYANFISWLLVSSFLFVLNLLTDSSHIWAFYPFLGWGLGVAFHAAEVFGVPGFSKEWERRKIQEELQQIQEEEEAIRWLEQRAKEKEGPNSEEELELKEFMKLRREWDDSDFV